MGRKGLLSVLVALLASFFFLVSCNPEISAVMGYPTPTVKGRITVPASSGLAAGDIWLKVVDGTETKYVGKVGSDGAFAVGGLEAAKQYSILFSSEEPDHGNISRDATPKAAGSGGGYGGWLTKVTAAINEGNDVGSVKMKPLGTITGVVKQKGAESHYDATVYIPGSSFIAMTDGEGNFSMFGVPQGTHTIRYTADGYVSVMKEGALLHSESDTENPVLTLAEVELVRNVGEVHGIAMLSGAADHAGITVKLEGEATSVEGSTSSNGDFRITDIPPGTYRAIISFPGYLTQTVGDVKVSTANTTTMDETTLVTNGGRITGKVKLNDGAGAEGAIVVARSSDGKFSYTGSTDAQGEYSLDNCYPGTYTVTISKTGYASHVESGVVSSAGNTTTLDEIVLSSSFGSVSGVVKDSRGNPLAHAQVNIGDFTAFTDSEGDFIKSDLPLGQYTITVSKDGYTTKTLAQKVNIESNKAATIGEQMLSSMYGSLSGTVKLQGTTDYSGILVTVSGSQTYTASTTGDGSYSVSALLPGTYSVILSKAGFVSKTIGDVVITADTNTLVAESTLVSSSCGISGRVVLEGSAGNSGAIISATLVGDSSKTYSAVTLEDGTYSFTGLDAGQYSMKMQMTSFVTDNSQLITTTYGEVSLVPTVTLKSVTSTVNGNVTLSGSIDHTGTNVLLKAADASRQYDVTTDRSGAYTITKVQPGVYDLYASKSGFETKTVTDITIEPTSTKTIDSVNLAVAIRSITGSVELELRTDHSGALVTATKVTDPTKVYSAISNSAGNYTLAGMEPGEYGIVITSAGYRTMTLPTTDVVADSTASLSKTSLLIARGTIAGIVTLEGRSSQEGTKVELLGTEYQTLTNALGEYSFNVPQGNYPGGLRFTKEDFKADSRTDTIPVLTDSVYAVPNTELKATHVSIYGRVDVQGTDDDSAVTVLFDNSTHSETVVTDATGAFRFDHVVLGSHTLRFTRDNTPDVTVQLMATPSDGMNVGTVVLTPNSASIHGIVKLKDVTSYAGVKVEVQVQDKGTWSTTTGAGGDYYIGGIYSVGTHTVTYSKNGWVSQSTTITGMSPLEDRAMAEVTLVDTTAPVLNSITINSGANTAANNTVTLHINATELGSGISKMQICYDNVFNQTVTMRDYSSSFDWALPSGNGLKTVYLKVYDASGNASNVASASVTLTDQKKEVKGVLTGEDLYWTEEKSPYLVTGNLLVQDTDTLTIDAGVDVQFAGNYYLQVEGLLKAIGTEANKISFYGLNGQTWSGINCTKDNGSRISYASIVDLVKGLQNYANVDNSSMESTTGYVLGDSIGDSYYSSSTPYKGVAQKNVISGLVRLNEATLYENDISLNSMSSNYVDKSFLSGNIIGGTRIDIRYSLCENTQFTNIAVSSQNTGMRNCTLQNCSVDMTDGGLYTQSVFTDCTFNNFTPAILHNSNLTNCSNISISTARSSIEEIDLRDNFWGYDKTREMDEKGLNYNLSFINDWYDDFNKTKAIVTGYKAEPYENIGYLGDTYYPTTESSAEYAIGETGPAGGLVFYDKGYYSYGWRYLEAAPSDLGSYVFGFYRATDTSDYLGTGTGLGIGSGRTNTEMLVESMGGEAYSNYNKDGVRTTDYAAKKCLDYEAGGHDDWFLPSKDELNLMRQNLYLNNLGGFSDDYCWSSSESVADYAWCQGFNDGGQYDGSRGYGGRVRPVRAF